MIKLIIKKKLDNQKQRGRYDLFQQDSQQEEKLTYCVVEQNKNTCSAQTQEMINIFCQWPGVEEANA